MSNCSSLDDLVGLLLDALEARCGSTEVAALMRLLVLASNGLTAAQACRALGLTGVNDAHAVFLHTAVCAVFEPLLFEGRGGPVIQLHRSVHHGIGSRYGISFPAPSISPLLPSASPSSSPAATALSPSSASLNSSRRVFSDHGVPELSAAATMVAAQLTRFVAGSLPNYLASGRPNQLKVSSLPVYQRGAGQVEESVVTLCDLEFVSSKCEAGMVDDLLADFVATRAMFYPLDGSPSNPNFVNLRLDWQAFEDMFQLVLGRQAIVRN
jgi:hypothetical protein